MKKLMGVLLFLCLVGSLQPHRLQASEACLEVITEEIGFDSCDLQNDELFAEYVEGQFYGRKEIGVLASDDQRKKLDGQELILYDTLKQAIIRIAAGEETSTRIGIPIKELLGQEIFTDEELGVESIGSKGDSGTPEEIKRILKAKIEYDGTRLMRALLGDCPGELYWFDKTKGMVMSFGFTRLNPDSNNVYHAIKMSFSISMNVAKDYAGTQNYTVDPTTGLAVANAVRNAKAIVEEGELLSDYERLLFYRNQICDRTSYDYEAISDAYTRGYGDPWQIIYVFDDNPETRSVCEGYAKAFQYLCDETAFETEITCLTIQGLMGSASHMWNILNMDNGENYFVDLTNSDTMEYSYFPELFLAPRLEGSVKNGYRIRLLSGGKSAVYYYDSRWELNYFEEELKLSDEEYRPYEDAWIEQTCSRTEEGLQVSAVLGRNLFSTRGFYPVRFGFCLPNSEEELWSEYPGNREVVFTDLDEAHSCHLILPADYELPVKAFVEYRMPGGIVKRVYAP